MNDLVNGPMTTANDHHLSDEQFSALLTGDRLDQAGQRHVAECARCRAEVEQFTSSVDLFSSASAAWAESRPAAPSLVPVSRSRERRALYMPVGWAVAAAMLVTLGLPEWNRRHASVGDTEVATTASTSDSAAQVAADNQLLQSVNVALSSNEDSPLPEYRLSGYDHSASRFAAGTDSRPR